MAKFYTILFTVLYSRNYIGQALIADILFKVGSKKGMGIIITENITNVAPTKVNLGIEASDFSFNDTSPYIDFKGIFDFRCGNSISLWFNLADNNFQTILSNNLFGLAGHLYAATENILNTLDDNFHFIVLNQLNQPEDVLKRPDLNLPIR
ncbi:hypothetical protein SAMN05661096_00739 [Marivirga sericea]|uniref:Uncharacterized protein n=1 Tax=Marivirga sericea TaxID=1028 RepID=A0A1X7IJW6_9BACT|nr:hypothetical protein [Marivirga sericea]SMG15211.1 hypothetical protein SAMN05661096_00739 [Marivirga sericea]